MAWIDWLIVIVPTILIISGGFYSRRYIRSVADFLAAGRVCGRYVIAVGDMVNALSIMGLAAYVEVHYKTGFALAFWQRIIGPLGVILGLLGYCTYRFRETKSMSLGQFLEMRYSRKFRIFAASLRSLSEMLANMIMPAIAARFFIYYLDLSMSLSVFGVNIPTFMVVVVICLTIAISLICMGGTLALVITDALQGMLVFPLITIFIIFVLTRFSWTDQIIPVMMDRVPDESFLNPYDISKLRDFNLFMVVVSVFAFIMHRASWIGAGYTGAARTPHEQKMAGILGTFRGTASTMFYLVIGVMIITLMSHPEWAPQAQKVRERISQRISEELVDNEHQRKELNDRIAQVSLQVHQIGVDPPLSQEKNLDTDLLHTAHETLKEYEGEVGGNAKFQQFRTLYHQMMMALSVRDTLPPVLTGLFCLLMILAMISTDDTRIYSATITLTQDVIMPVRKKPFSPRQHMWALRLVAIGVGLFFLVGSFFMAQLDYIQMFINLMISIWTGGCGPVMIFGLYSRFGTTAGAWASLVSGMIISTFNILVSRNWADVVYPWLDRMGWVDNVGHFFEAVSRPLNPYVVWKMNAVKYPINAYELYFMTMLLTLIIYCVVSWLTMKEPFNLDRMLHRGKYNIEGINKEKMTWTVRTFFSKLVGITKEYSRGDRIIAWSLVMYSFVYSFFGAFVFVVIWNMFSPWTIEWWGWYFLVVGLLVPGLVTLISTFWFGIGGVIDLYRLFRDLKARVIDPLDDGWVEGHVSLADKAAMEKLEQEKSNPDKTNKSS